MLKALLAGLFVLQATWTVSSSTDIMRVLPEDVSRPDASLALSPDGTLAAWGDQQEGLCLYTLASGQGRCYPWPAATNIRLDATNRLAWSPDSRQIAVTDNFFAVFAEPDIWVFDLETEFFTNRTPDDFTLVRLGEDSSDQIDYLPTWGLAGELYFFRSSDAGDGYTLDLYKLLPDSTTPELVADYTDTLPRLSIYMPPALSPDGTRLAVIVQDAATAVARNSVWIINLVDGGAEPVVNAVTLQAGYPDWGDVGGITVLDVDWAGNNALVVADGNLADVPYALQNYHYVDLATQAVTPLVDLSVIATRLEALEMSANGHSGLYIMPRLGFVMPDAFIYGHYDQSAAEVVTLSAIALPPNGSEPQVIDELEGCSLNILRGLPDFARSLTAARTAAVYNCIVAFT